MDSSLSDCPFVSDVCHTGQAYSSTDRIIRPKSPAFSGRLPAKALNTPAFVVKVFLGGYLPGVDVLPYGINNYSELFTVLECFVVLLSVSLCSRIRSWGFLPSHAAAARYM